MHLLLDDVHRPDLPCIILIHLRSRVCCTKKQGSMDRKDILGEHTRRTEFCDVLEKEDARREASG